MTSDSRAAHHHHKDCNDFGEAKGKLEALPRFANMAEVHQALETKAVTLHTKILARVLQADEDGNNVMKRLGTTPAAC